MQIKGSTYAKFVTHHLQLQKESRHFHQINGVELMINIRIEKEEKKNEVYHLMG